MYKKQTVDHTAMTAELMSEVEGDRTTTADNDTGNVVKAGNAMLRN